MKKLTVLVVVILIAGLLTGCWLFSDEPELISITVDPEDMELAGPIGTNLLSTTEHIISVTANYDDWTTKDIAPIDCGYLSSDPDIAIVDIVGDKVWIRAIGTGETYILVSYTEGKFPFKTTQEDIVGVTVN